MNDIEKYNEIIYNSNLNALKLNLKFPHDEMFKELSKLKMTPQINNDKWTGTALRGIASDKPRPYYEYGYKSELDVPYKWTKQSDKCQITKYFIEHKFIGCNLFRIKVNVLLPDGRIHLHNDSIKPGLGLSDKTSDSDTTFISLAVRWPKDVIFNVGKYRIPFQTGDAYLLNFSKNHEVYNPTNQERYYLLLTGQFHNSKSWRKLVIDSFQKNKYKSFDRKIKII